MFMVQSQLLFPLGDPLLSRQIDGITWRGVLARESPNRCRGNEEGYAATRAETAPDH